MSNVDLSLYRPCVGLMLLNDKGQVWVGERIDTLGAWQMPQGGIDDGESPLEAALREMEEEIGVTKDKVEIIQSLDDWVTYDLPAEKQNKLWGGKYVGQRQIWFQMRFKGNDGDINIETEHPEFTRWQWIDMEDLPRFIVRFKRAVYQEVINIFTSLPDKRMAYKNEQDVLSHQHFDFDETDIKWADGQHLYKWWLDQKTDGSFPSRRQFNPKDHTPILPFIFLFNVEWHEGDPHFNVRLMGSEHIDFMGYDATGFKVEQMLSGDTLKMRFLELVKRGQPYLARNVPLPWPDQKYKSYDALMLPLSEDGVTINMIISHIHYHT